MKNSVPRQKLTAFRQAIFENDYLEVVRFLQNFKNEDLKQKDLEIEFFIALHKYIATHDDRIMRIFIDAGVHENIDFDRNPNNATTKAIKNLLETIESESH